MDEAKTPNALETASIPGLMLKYSIPSVVSMLAMSLYNIVDQIFIGWGVGYLGNAATTVAFPLITIGLALALLMGNGAAAFISLELGRGRSDMARKALGNAIFMLIIFSGAFTVIVFSFLEPILLRLGATEAVMPHAIEYTRYIMVGMPFSMCATAIANVIRADGSPRYAMVCVLSGVVLSAVLDPIFIFTLNMGVKGAAVTTAISQIFSFMLVLYYLLHKAKYVRVSIRDLKPEPFLIRKIAGLGSSSFANQISMFFVTIVLNNLLIHYGAASAYGSEVPLAAVGIVMKINAILVSTILGISIGLQPILGFNYGAGNYKRVRDTFLTGIKITGLLAVVVNILFVVTPATFIGFFGDTDVMFNQFACHALSVFMGCVFAAGIQIPSSMYFMAIGKPVKAMALSMSRQIFSLIPLMLLLPLFFGLNGILYASPAADIISLLATGFFMLRELARLNAAYERDDATTGRTDAVTKAQTEV